MAVVHWNNSTDGHQLLCGNHHGKSVKLFTRLYDEVTCKTCVKLLALYDSTTLVVLPNISKE